MHVTTSKALWAKVAIALVAVAAGLVVNPAPAQAATSCTTRKPVRVGSQIQYSIAVRGSVPRGSRYYVRVRWFPASVTTYSATVATFRRPHHRGVHEAAGWIVRANGAGTRVATCRAWRSDEL
jgi:hypothetical protein